MHPILFSIDRWDFPIHTYGVLMAVAFAAGLIVAVQLGRQEGIPSQEVGDISIVALVAGLIGARLLYVVVEWDQFAERPATILLRRDGFVFYGGLLLAIPACILFLRRRKLDYRKIADVFAPAVALGHSIGRLGCFAQGCCYGALFDHGLIFPEGSPASYRFGDEPVHPTQLYESLLLFGVFCFLLSRFRKKSFDGQVFLEYLALYSIVRFTLEFARADDRGFYVGGLSVSQVISVALIAGVMFIRLRMRRPAA